MSQDEREARINRVLSGITGAVGSYPAVLWALAVVVAWGVLGPVFQFSDTWQLFINTGTTIVSFWMAFVIQATQNRDGRAIQTKLDAILCAVEDVPNSLMGLEERPEGEIKAAQAEVRGDGD